MISACSARRDFSDLLVRGGAVVGIVARHVVARAAHRAAEQQALALVLDNDIRQRPLGAAGLVSTGEHMRISLVRGAFVRPKAKVYASLAPARSAQVRKKC